MFFAPLPRGELLRELRSHHLLVALGSRLQLFPSPAPESAPLALPSEPLVPRHQLRHSIGETGEKFLPSLGDDGFALELTRDRRGPARATGRLGAGTRRRARRGHRPQTLLRRRPQRPGPLTPARRRLRQFSRRERQGPRRGPVAPIGRIHRRGHPRGERGGLREALQHPELHPSGQHLTLQTPEQGMTLSCHPFVI